MARMASRLAVRVEYRSSPEQSMLTCRAPLPHPAAGLLVRTALLDQAGTTSTNAVYSGISASGSRTPGASNTLASGQNAWRFPGRIFPLLTVAASSPWAERTVTGVPSVSPETLEVGGSHQDVMAPHPGQRVPLGEHHRVELLAAPRGEPEPAPARVGVVAGRRRSEPSRLEWETGPPRRGAPHPTARCHPVPSGSPPLGRWVPPGRSRRGCPHPRRTR